MIHLKKKEGAKKQGQKSHAIKSQSRIQFFQSQDLNNMDLDINYWDGISNAPIKGNHQSKLIIEN